MKAIRSFLFGVALFATATSAMAQFGMPGMPMPTLQYNPALLMDGNVQKDMHLTTDQSSKIQNAIMQSAVGAMKSAKEATGKNMAAGYLGMMEQMEKATLHFLNPAQKARLHQITLQVTGVMAFADKKVGEEVGLSPAQQEKISKRLGEISLSAYKGMNISGDPTKVAGHLGELQTAQKKLKAEASRVVFAILTPKQKEKWAKIQGPRIKLSPMFSALMGN